MPREAEAADCDLCTLEVALKARSDELRRTLQRMAPWDRHYEDFFAALVETDGCLRMLREGVSHA